MFCNKCSKEIKDDSVFCNFCGNKITTEDTKNLNDTNKEEEKKATKNGKDDKIYKSCPNCGKLIKWEAVICPYCNSRYPKIEFQELRGGMIHPVESGKSSRTSDYKRPLSIVLMILLGIAFLFILLMDAVLKTPLLAIIIFFPIFILITFILIFINLGKNKRRMIGFIISTCLMIVIFIISLFSYIFIEIKNSATKAPVQIINTTTTKMGIADVSPETTNASATTVLETTTTAEATTTTVKSIFAIGDVIDLKGTIITVTKFEKSNGGDFDKPKEGMEYIIVNIKIINKTNSNIPYNPFDFKMQNSKGQINDMAFTIVNSNTALESGELVPNGEVEGTIVFEEPKNDSELMLIYQPNYFNDKEVIKISIK